MLFYCVKVNELGRVAAITLGVPIRIDGGENINETALVTDTMHFGLSPYQVYNNNITTNDN